VFFEICGDITDVETFAVEKAIRELPRLRKIYGAESVAKTQGRNYRETPE